MGHSQWPVCQATGWQEGTRTWTIIEHILSVYTLPTCVLQSTVNSVVFHPNGKQVLTTGKGAIVCNTTFLCHSRDDIYTLTCQNSITQSLA